ncbi:hypothetical protein LCGC14_0297580 [marine sediment metagenome]|uniref:Uncharacterized protein n=1 Tax=marine sediment metagenome TaxID=412755 RepID=A0A0F9TR28_9ZZZZ
MAADDVTVWNGDGNDNAFATAANWEGDAIPQSTGGSIFPALAQATAVDVAGSDQSAIELVDTMIEPGCALNFGSRPTPLWLDTDNFIDSGTGKKFLKFDACASMRLLSGAASAAGYSYGTNITSVAAITLLTCNVGKSHTVGIAAHEDEVATVTTMSLLQGIVTIGNAVASVGTMYVDGATVSNNSACTTLNVSSGAIYQRQGTAATVNLKGGRLYLNMPAANMPTTVNLYGGILDMSQDGIAKTVGTLNYYGGQIYDPANILTITTLNRFKGGTISVA